MATGETPPVALSLAQQRESLWADHRLKVYAVIRGSRIAGLRERLARADVADWHGLWTGELEPEEQAAAPVLVLLRPVSAFTDWLIAKGALDFPAWGVLVLSANPFLAMRAHGRALCKAQLPGGEPLRLDWADPEVLGVVLPAAPLPQLQRVFSGMDAVVAPEVGRWTRWSLPLGRLQVQHTAVLPA